MEAIDDAMLATLKGAHDLDDQTRLGYECEAISPYHPAAVHEIFRFSVWKHPKRLWNMLKSEKNLSI